VILQDETNERKVFNMMTQLLAEGTNLAKTQYFLGVWPVSQSMRDGGVSG